MSIYVKLFLFLLMLWLHYIDDIKLQGLLCEHKQRKFWIENAPQDMYKYDYLMALAMHGFSWSFSIMIIPMLLGLYYNSLSIWHFIIFIINWGLHSYIDNLKANKFKINLIQDQISHVLQVFITWIIFVLCG